jgi:hypothetical protein
MSGLALAAIVVLAPVLMLSGCASYPPPACSSFPALAVFGACD